MAPSELLEFENPYQAPVTLAETLVDISATDELIELRAFVGPKFEHYLRKWHPRLEDPAGDAGISWVAFFIPVWWLGYRKLYAAVFLYAILTIAVKLGLQAIFIHGLGQPDAPLPALAVAWLLIQVACLLYGNAWYLRHAQHEIASLKHRGAKGGELLQQIARRGGTSVLGIVLAMFISGMMSIVGAVVAISLGFPL